MLRGQSGSLNGCRRFEGAEIPYADVERAMRKARKASAGENACRSQRLLQRRDACIARRDGGHGGPWHGIGERAEVPDSGLVR